MILMTAAYSDASGDRMYIFTENIAPTPHRDSTILGNYLMTTINQDIFSVTPN